MILYVAPYGAYYPVADLAYASVELVHVCLSVAGGLGGKLQDVSWFFPIRESRCLSG